MNDEQEEALGIDIINSVAADNINDISAALMDISLETLWEGGVLDGIPVVGMASKAIKSIFILNGQLNLRKVACFMLQLKDIPQAERERFVHQYDEQPKEKKKLAEQVALLLSKLDDMEKADILGLLFKHLVAGKVDYDSFRRYAIMLDRTHLPDLVALTKASPDGATPEPDLSDTQMTALYTLGLCSTPYMEIVDPARPTYRPESAGKTHVLVIYLLDLGKKLQQLLLDKA